MPKRIERRLHHATEAKPSWKLYSFGWIATVGNERGEMIGNGHAVRVRNAELAACSFSGPPLASLWLSGFRPFVTVKLGIAP